MSTSPLPEIAKRGMAVESVFVALTATASVGVAVVHGLALPARVLAPEPTPASAAALTTAVLAVAAVHAGAMCAVGRTAARRIGLAAALLAAGVLLTEYGAIVASAAALFVTAAAQVWAASAIADRLSDRLTGVRRRRPLASIGWALLAVGLLVQSARLSTFMADPSADYWLTTRDPLWAQHMCMPAYIQAADLQRQGVDNVYDARFYPVLSRTAVPTPGVRNMDRWIGDPFQYPPPFLLLPRLALAFTDDFHAMRAQWYVLQLLTFLSAALALSAWIGGRAGWAMALLIPAVWLSLPAMQSLQYGQFHMAAVSLALLGMLAFERRWDAAGGALLAVAAMSKIFPGILIVWLVAGRRWREVTWTAAMGTALALLALAVLGVAPFEAFVSYQLPRLSTGAAFDFSAEWPEFTTAFIADNLSPAGVVEKLAALGVPGMTRSFARLALGLYALAVVVAAVAAGRRQVRDRRSRAVVWLALLNLAALQSFAAWGDYVTLGTAWLVTVIVPARDQTLSWSQRVLLVVASVLFFVVPGVQPIPRPLPVPVAMLLTTVVTIGLIAANAWALGAWRGPARSST